ncbi:MAG: metallophosphoesterase family protein [Actinomycetota bacterium]|nr:metallophosphoesterase family protein [Actinomycetota bacterium]
MSANVRVVVLADTHLGAACGSRPVRRWLPPPAESVLAGCDAVLHAGDILDRPTLERIADTAAAGGARPPVYAVLGNNDTDLTGILPPVRHLALGGVRVAMIHDSGPRPGRAGRLRRRFPDAQLVVFGHSHAPIDDEGVDGQRLFNPGSPTQRRAEPRHTLGELHLGGGAIVSHRIIALD